MSIQVPPEDESALRELALALEVTDPDIVRAHPFDGAVMLHLLVPLTAGAVTVLKTWIRSRQERASHYKITCSGIEITGYSAEEAERFLSKFLAAGSDDNP